MARVTELERLLTQIRGLSGPVKDITRVSIIANSSKNNEVLNRKRIHPYFHLVTHTLLGGIFHPLVLAAVWRPSMTHDTYDQE